MAELFLNEADRYRQLAVLGAQYPLSLDQMGLLAQPEAARAWPQAVPRHLWSARAHGGRLSKTRAQRKPAARRSVTSRGHRENNPMQVRLRSHDSASTSPRPLPNRQADRGNSEIRVIGSGQRLDYRVSAARQAEKEDTIASWNLCSHSSATSARSSAWASCCLSCSIEA